MSGIGSFPGTSFRIITCDDHVSYGDVLYSVQVYHVTHVLQLVVYALVYVFAALTLYFSAFSRPRCSDPDAQTAPCGVDFRLRVSLFSCPG